MVYDSQRARIVLFGGYMGGSGFQSDTWEWDGTQWNQVQVSGPAARSQHGMAYDRLRRRAVLFGGIGDLGRKADTWEYGE